LKIEIETSEKSKVFVGQAFLPVDFSHRCQTGHDLPEGMELPDGFAKCLTYV
jgi:hypothetical protein